MTDGPNVAPPVELWVQPDGTICRLSELDEAPRFELVLVRSGSILRCRRLYSPAAAQVLAHSWMEESASGDNR
jgi:hypothetical protein